MSWDNNNLHHSHHHHQQQIPSLTIDLNHEFVEQLDHQDHQFFINSTTATTTSPPPATPTIYNYNHPSSSSSSSQPFLFSPLDQANPLANYDHFHHQDHEAKMMSSAPEGGSCCSDEEMKLVHMGGGGINDQKRQNIPNQLGTSVKWMSSKMRIMRKMMIPPDHHTSSKQLYSNSNLVHQDHDRKQHQPPNSHDHHEVDHGSSNVTVRVCSDCNTTKTPLWRSGPRGPKSLCNACGIRQRKARRAAMAAAAANYGGSGAEITTAIMPSKSKLQCKNKRSSTKGSTCAAGQLKKKCKVVVQHSPPVLSSDQEILKDSDTSSSNSINNNKNSNNNSGTKKLCFEDLRVILSNKSAFQRAVFPQDEKEGAILLMALSYGLVQS